MEQKKKELSKSKPISQTSEWGKTAMDFLGTIYKENINAIANIKIADAEGDVNEILTCLQAVADFTNNIIQNLSKEYAKDVKVQGV